jgi:hypothetical protein
VGRRSADITHPLNVLEDAALVAREADLFRRGRWLYRVTEPLIAFYEVVMRPEWYRLEIGHAESVWRDQQPDFLSRVVGPHVESLCRFFAMRAGSSLFASPVGEVGSGIVNDPANRTQIEIDVAVLASPEPGRPRRLLSLGEVKWGQVMTPHHTARLARARDLLAANFDVSDCTLACYSGAGFSPDLRSTAGTGLTLISASDLYR